jgi:hypothetical protein
VIPASSAGQELEHSKKLSAPHMQEKVQAFGLLDAVPHPSPALQGAPSEQPVGGPSSGGPESATGGGALPSSSGGGEYGGGTWFEPGQIWMTHSPSSMM